MFRESILYLLLLGVTVRFSFSEHQNNSNSIILYENWRTNPNGFMLVNPKQINRLETTIRRFLSKIAEPIKHPIILRSTSKNGKDVQLTIREMCESMRNALVKFAEECGLTNVVRRHEQGLNNFPLSEDWFSETLLQGSYILRDLGKLINEIDESIDLNFGERNETTRRGKQSTRQSNSFQFLGVVYDAADFSERLSQCLLRVLNHRRSHKTMDLNQAILNIIKHPPKIALQTLRSNMEDISYNDPRKSRANKKYWQMLLCLAIKNDAVNYDDCVRDVGSLETCLHELKQRSSNERKSLHGKSWVKAIERLSDCKIRADKRGEVEVSCKSARRIPRRMKQKVRYLMERILDKEISTRSPFDDAVNDLSDTLAGSDWGQRFVDELCQYFAIYEDGKRKLKRLSMIGEEDRRAVVRQREISKAMQTYRKGVLLRTFNAVGKMHRSAITFEKLLVKGIKDTLNEAWQSHLKILSSLMDWMTKLLELYSGEDVSGKEQSSSDTSLAEWSGNEDSNIENDSRQVVASRFKSEIMKEADIAMNNLMESMNRVGRNRNMNNSSMLSCLANNLLLVTMFMETIGFISTLYCFDHAVKNEPNFIDFEDQWNRARRSLPLDYVSQDYLLVYYENSTIDAIEA